MITFLIGGFIGGVIGLGLIYLCGMLEIKGE